MHEYTSELERRWQKAGRQGQMESEGDGDGAGDRQRRERKEGRSYHDTRVEGQPGDHNGTLTGATVQDGLGQVAACLGVSPGSFVGKEFEKKTKFSPSCEGSYYIQSVWVM